MDAVEYRSTVEAQLLGYQNMAMRTLGFAFKIVGEESVNGTSWTWQPPTTDFKGYMAELYRQENGTDVIVGTIAVDVFLYRVKILSTFYISIGHDEHRQVVETDKALQFPSCGYFLDCNCHSCSILRPQR